MNKEKSFVIVGGSQSHVSFIKAAHKLGFSVIVFDQDAECAGSKYCDYFYKISTQNKKKIVEKCIEIDRLFELLGIMTYSASDKSLIAVSSACSILGLPSFSTECISRVTDKNIMKDCFKKHNVPLAEGIVIEKPIDAINFFRKVGKIVLKPSIGGRGSKGVALCDDESFIIDQFKCAKDASENHKVIVEKYYEGNE